MTDKIQACDNNYNATLNATTTKKEPTPTKKEPTPEEIKLFDYNGNGKIDSDKEIEAYNMHKIEKELQKQVPKQTQEIAKELQKEVQKLFQENEKKNPSKNYFSSYEYNQ